MLLRELFFKQLNEATLRRGSRGEDVKALQRALGIRPADGIFGPQTERAVRNFQTAAQITVDGIAGGQTQAAIRKFAEQPGASRDYGQVRPGTDWSELDPGEIEVTPRQEPVARSFAAPDTASGMTVGEPTVDDTPFDPTQTVSDEEPTAPEVDTTAPAQPAAPSADDEQELSRSLATGDDAAAGRSPASMQTPDMDATPSVDTTAAAAQQLSRFQQAYGVGTGSNGLPTTFRDRFLNPALDNLGSRTMQALSDELEGEIPSAPARVIVQQLERQYGTEQELQQAAQEMRSDTDPEIQDQVRALEVLIPLMRKLRQDAARNESVELNRLKMLAGV